jgi:hypothetical protein
VVCKKLILKTGNRTQCTDITPGIVNKSFGSGRLVFLFKYDVVVILPIPEYFSYSVTNLNILSRESTKTMERIRVTKETTKRILVVVAVS